MREDVCKITTKVEDFDELMPIVQIWVGKFEIRVVLLDGGSSVNIISKSLKKRLGLKKPQSTRRKTIFCNLSYVTKKCHMQHV